MKHHVNIPIFIPHLGCPNTCVFCNQRTISGVYEFKLSEIREQIELALSTIRESQSAEIAFFGGSFTGIDRDLMISLLELASEYVRSKRVKSIRCSTRPDYINKDVLDILKSYNVTVIELGLQSVNDKVLHCCKRGHSSLDALRACKLIKEYGFSLVGQMMIGLPGSTLENELQTAEFIVNNGAEFARIYPTVVFRDTELYQMTKNKEYTPLTLDEAVTRSAAVMRKLFDGGVEVIRTGLCASENLLSDKTYYKGPNHAALGELVAGEVYYQIMCEKLNVLQSGTKAVNILVPARELSKAIGQRKINLEKLKRKYKGVSFLFSPCDKLSRYQVIIESIKEEN